MNTDDKKDNGKDYQDSQGKKAIRLYTFSTHELISMGQGQDSDDELQPAGHFFNRKECPPKKGHRQYKEIGEGGGIFVRFGLKAGDHSQGCEEKTIEEQGWYEERYKIKAASQEKANQKDHARGKKAPHHTGQNLSQDNSTGTHR
jgi:hypothetical protein